MASPEADEASVSAAIAKVRSMHEAISRRSFASRDVVDAVAMSIACLMTYWLMTSLELPVGFALLALVLGLPAKPDGCG